MSKQKEHLAFRLIRWLRRIVVVLFLLPGSFFAVAALVTTCGTVKPVAMPTPKLQLEIEIERPKPEKPKIECPVGTNEITISALSDDGEVTKTSIDCILERIPFPFYWR